MLCFSGYIKPCFKWYRCRGRGGPKSDNRFLCLHRLQPVTLCKEFSLDDWWRCVSHSDRLLDKTCSFSHAAVQICVFALESAKQLSSAVACRVACPAFSMVSSCARPKEMLPEMKPEKFIWSLTTNERFESDKYEWFDSTDSKEIQKAKKKELRLSTRSSSSSLADHLHPATQKAREKTSEKKKSS